MNDDDTEPDGTDRGLPADPFEAIDGERIANEVGGQIVGSIVRGLGARLDVGCLKRQLRSMDVVTIRMYRQGGRLAAKINLGPDEVDELLRCLHTAAAAAWGTSAPDPPLEPRTDWDQPPPADEET
jgi:hypothetical protein